MAEVSWPLEGSGYSINGIVGRGSFSKVCTAVNKANGAGGIAVAIKIMDLDSISTSFEDIFQEVSIMKMSDDPNILRCFCSFVDANQLWLVTELMDMGSAQRIMSISKAQGLGEGMQETWFAYILRETLQGLNYLHKNGQIHRDIKSGNILLDAQGSVRLADFGVSGWMVSRGLRQETVKTFVGTPCYMAPEVMEQAHGYDARADIWSLGITALELAKGVAPYAHHSPMRVLILTIEEEPPGLYSYADDKEITGAPFSKHYEDFFKKCLQKNPKSRPTADELLRHKFLKSRTKEALVDELLTRIPTVASAYPANSGSACTAALNDCAGDRSRLPGESRIQLDLERGEQAGSGGYAGGGSDEGSFASGTSWVFDLDEPSFESQSRVFRRTSGGQGGSSSSLRVTLRASGSGAALGSIGDSAGALAGEAPSSSKRNHVASENVDMQDFLRDFENEISVGEAVERPADVPTATRGDVKESNTSNTPGASASASASPPARAARAARASSDSETAIFMDELEGIVDGNG